MVLTHSHRAELGAEGPSPTGRLDLGGLYTLCLSLRVKGMEGTDLALNLHWWDMVSVPSEIMLAHSFGKAESPKGVSR